MAPGEHTIGVMISGELLGQGDEVEIAGAPDLEEEFAEQYESEDEGFSGGLKAAATREFKNCCKAEERVARSAARWNATAVRELEAFLEGKLKEQTPTQEHYAAREIVIQRVNQLVSNGLLQYNGMHVEHYGSFTSGLFTPNGDLDISIEGVLTSHPNTQRKGSELLDGLEGSNVCELDKDEKAALLRALGNKLRNKNVCTGRIEFILHARVPIIKFMESQTEIPCDMAVGSGGARFKSTVLLHLSNIDARFPALLRLVKLWAKAFHMNDASNGTFNTFALTLMVVFHLQTRSPPILPPICELFNLPAHATTERPLHKGREADMSLLKVSEQRAAAWGPGGNAETVLELLFSFFTLYSGALGTWAVSKSDRAVRCSTWAGDWFHRTWVRNHIVPVEDPFDVTDNCARSIFAANIGYVRGCFTKAADALRELPPESGLESTIKALFSEQEMPRIRHPFARGRGAQGWREAGWGRNGGNGGDRKGRNRRGKNDMGPSRDAEPKPDRWTSNTPVAKSAGVAAQVAQVSQILEQQRMASQPPPPGMGPPLLSRAASGGAGMGLPMLPPNGAFMPPPPGWGHMPPGLAAAPPLPPYRGPQFDPLQPQQLTSQMLHDRAPYESHPPGHWDGLQAALAGSQAIPPPGFALPGVREPHGGAPLGYSGHARGSGELAYSSVPPGYGGHSQGPPMQSSSGRAYETRSREDPQHLPQQQRMRQQSVPERASSSHSNPGREPGSGGNPLGKLFAEAAERYQKQQGLGGSQHNESTNIFMAPGDSRAGSVDYMQPPQEDAHSQRRRALVAPRPRNKMEEFY